MRVEMAERVRIEGGVVADLYARHADNALRLAFPLTGNRATAEDLVLAPGRREDRVEPRRVVAVRRVRPSCGASGTPGL